MSRVGGGGYAESRGGFGDRTGGGMSGNARDGRDGMGNKAGRDGFAAGMFGATARRSPVKSPSYEASLGNLARMGATLAPGGGLITGAGAMLNGNFGPGSGGYTGYGGQVSTPGSYDPKGGMEPVGMGGALGSQTKGSQFLRQSDYGGYPVGYPLDLIRQKMFMPPQQQAAPVAAPAPAPLKPQSFAPGMFLNTGGKYGGSAFRPGYNFFGPGSY